jgi:hypothetical protein
MGGNTISKSKKMPLKITGAELISSSIIRNLIKLLNSTRFPKKKGASI